MPDCPEFQVPPNALILNELRIVEYLEGDEIWKMDLSCDGSGSEMFPGKYFELAGWAQMMAAAPVIAQMVSAELFGEDEDGGEEEISEVTA
jgi:hypothetical protein